jgi:hypothetical protein
MSAALQRILELERDGIELSRNRHFELFENQENRAALEIWKHVASVRRALLQQRSQGRVMLRLHRTEDGQCVLEAALEEIEARSQWHLAPGEVGLLLRDQGIREWFEAEGIELPDEARAYLGR